MKSWFQYLKKQKAKEESQQSVQNGGPTEQTNWKWIMDRFMRKE